MDRPWSSERVAANGIAVRENFATWFGQSKAIGPDGMPLVLYHGTNRSFDSFDPALQGSNVRGNPTTRMGLFFTDSACGARRWAEYKWSNRPGANIMAVYLSIQRPRAIKAERFAYFLKSARAATIDAFIAKSIAKGHDGLCIDYKGRPSGDAVPLSERWWVAFSPAQVKSAIGNSGLFLRDSASLADRIDPALQARIEVVREVIARRPDARVRKAYPGACVDL